MEILGEYTSGDDLMHMSYAFELLSSKLPTAQYIADVFAQIDQVAADGWACWAFSNHDVPRHVSRWKLSDAAARCFATLMQCLRGSTCIYQGEELALPEADVAFEDLQDPYGIRFWPAFKGRDGCRTPMVWEQSNQNGGFSTGRPWLPVSHDHLNRTVADLEQDPATILHHYRKAIAFRHAHEALRKGAQTDVTVSGDVLTFRRTTDQEQIFCAFNLSGEPGVVDMPDGNWHQIGVELGSTGPAPDGKLHLGPWQPALMTKIAS